MADMNVPRMYHSTAVLLPDGSILSGGHVPLPNPFSPVRDSANPQIAETRLEVYEPPYMAWPDRPAIVDAPDDATWGGRFSFQLDAATDIDSVVLMRPGATTHAYDADQRGILLRIVDVDGRTVTVEAPSDSTVAPPGPYMLFVNRDAPEGIQPSEATWLMLD